MKLQSIRAFAAAISVTAIAATAASAATIVRPVDAGPFSSANPLGTILAINVSNPNTYDFTFTMGPTGGSVLTQVQASIPGPVSEPIQYSLFAGAPGSGVLIDKSALALGPSLTDSLGVGDYYLQIDFIASNGELLTGGLAVLAVPEPAAWSSMLVGIAGLGATMRALRRRPAAFTA